MAVVTIIRQGGKIEVLSADAIILDEKGFEFRNGTISGDCSSGNIQSGRYDPPLGSKVIIT